MINYKLFTKLYNEALSYKEVEFFIAERGWQEWMNLFDDEMIAKILKTIYKYSEFTLKKIRKNLNVSRADFSREYNIPLRTIEDWDAEKSKIPEYTERLIKYTLFIKEVFSDVENIAE